MATAPVDSERRQAIPLPPASRETDSEGRFHAIPLDRELGWVARLCVVEPHSPTAVRFRHFAVRIRALMDQRKRHSLLVTSAVAGEGKTTVSVNLALAMASISPEIRIALVDMDLRHNKVAEAIGCRSRASGGIEDVLEGRLQLSDVCVQTDLIGFDLYPAIRSVYDAHRLLGGPAEKVFAELHDRYDYVICDGPPVLPVPDVPLLVPHVGGCLAVVAAGRSRHSDFRELLQLVPRSAWLGTFVNENRFISPGGNYRYGYGEDEIPFDEDDHEHSAGYDDPGFDVADEAADRKEGPP